MNEDSKAGSMSDRRFTISFHGDVTLNEKEIWPDGDGPESPTVADVEERLEECGPLERLLGDWNLAEDINVSVTRRYPWESGQ